MTCADHAVPIAECVGCTGWDRAKAQRALDEGDLYGIGRATLRAALAEIDRLTAENEALRCGDLVPFVDGELDSARTEAFQGHLARCATCQSELGPQIRLATSLGAMAETGEHSNG